MSEYISAFSTDGALFPAEDLLSIPDQISGSIDKNGKIRLSAEEITLSAGGLPLMSASALLTNDKIELIGEWLGLSLTLRAEIDDNSFMLVGDTRFETGINILRKMSIPNPLGGEIVLGKIHINSTIEVEIHIDMSLDTLSVMLTVAFSCLGNHRITFELEELPNNIDDFANLIRNKVTVWALDNLLPDSLLPKDGDLLPANPFVTVTGKLSGSISPKGEIYLSASNVSLSAINGAFAVGQADALLTNDLIEVKGKWLNTLEIGLSIGISEDNLSLSGDTHINIDSFNIVLPFNKLPNPFGSILSRLSDALSCSVSADIHVVINNADFRADLELEIDCMGNHQLPTLSITASPSDLTDLINTIKDEVIDWVTNKLSPDKLLPWGGLFPANDYIELTGNLHGSLSQSNMLLKAENIGFKLLKGKMAFASVNAELSLVKLYIAGDFSIIQTSLITLKGKASVGLEKSTALTLLGSLTAGTGVIGLSLSASLVATNLGKSNGKLTITGSFNLLDTPLLKLGGASVVIILTNTDLSLSGTITGNTGALNLTAGLTISGNNMLSNPIISVAASFSFIDNTVIKFKGALNVSFASNGTYAVSGNADLDLFTTRLVRVSILSANSTSSTLSASFTNNKLGPVGVSGNLNGTLYSNKTFSLTSNGSATLGYGNNNLGLFNATATFNQNGLSFTTSFLGVEFTIYAYSNRMYGEFSVDIPLSLSIDFLGGSRSFRPSLGATVKIYLSPTFKIEITGHFDLRDGWGADITFTIISPPANLSDVLNFTYLKNNISSEIQKTIYSLISFPHTNERPNFHVNYSDVTGDYGYYTDGPHVDGIPF